MDFSIIERASSGVVLPPVWTRRSLLGGADTACLCLVVLPLGQSSRLAQNRVPRLCNRVGFFCDERKLAHDAHMARLCAAGFVFRILFQRMDSFCQSLGFALFERGILARILA